MPLRLLPAGTTPARPLLITAAGRYDTRGIMALAHQLARENVARAAARGVVRRYSAALKISLADAWQTAQTQRWCHGRDAALDVLPVSHALILAERTAALMIDSDRRMVAELSAIDARAAALGVRL